MSLSLLVVDTHTESRKIWRYLQLLMISLSDFLGDIPWMLVHYFQIVLISCMSVSLFVCLLLYQNYTKPYLRFCMRYLSEIFWRHSWDAGTLFPKNSKFLVCLSVCLFAYFLTKFRQGDISSSGWDIFLKFFGDISGMLAGQFQMIL